MEERFDFRVWHREKKHLYNNVAIGVGANKVGYKMSGKKRYSWEKTEDIEINQYTGFKDSLGNQIFEGDIVKFGKRKPYLATSYWDGYRFVFKKKNSKKLLDLFEKWGSIGYVELVGNVYENKELLEKLPKKEG